MSTKAHGAPPAAQLSLFGFLRETYFSFDRRTLGLTRWFLGWLLLTDLFRRTPDWNSMFSTEGVLPNQLALWRPQARDSFSIVNGFSTPTELAVLWVMMFVTFLCVMVGYRTRLFQVLALIFVTGMNGRVLLIENGGYVVYNLLLLWTAFLPLGDRFSVDSMLASMRRKKETSAAELNQRDDLIEPFRLAPKVTIVGLIFVLQLAAIYYFNVIHKTGPAWRNGTAVHYVMYVDRMVTPLIAHTREHIPWFVYIILTKSVMASEAGLPVCLLTPLGKAWARRLALVLMNFLHIGFGSTFVLGPFAWALCVFSTLLIGPEDWRLFERTMWRRRRARTILFDPRSPTALLACRLLVRMDRFGLLWFRERAGVEGRLAVLRPGKKVVTRGRALAQIIAALPLGPTISWIPQAAHPVVDAAWRRLERHSPARFFGWVKPQSSQPIRPMSPLRRRAGKFVEVFVQLGAFAMFLGAINQALVELWVTRDRWKDLIAELNEAEMLQSRDITLVVQPEIMRDLSNKGRFLQGWFMFSPNPVIEDGTIVTDAITIDGRHIDPITGEPPNWDLINAKSFAYNQIWSDYYNRIQLPGNRPYRPPFEAYMHRLPLRTGNPNDELVRGDVYWIKDMNPQWRSTRSFRYERVKLFSFGDEEKPQSVRDLNPSLDAQPAVGRVQPREGLPKAPTNE